MNAYFCNAGYQDVLQEYIDYWARYEPAFICDVVYAETPGKAKTLFLDSIAHSTYTEYTDIRCKKIASHIIHTPGLAKSDDVIWQSV